MHRKYSRLQQIESHQLFQETMFTREHKNLDGYFWKQMQNTAKDLETRAAKIEHRCLADFQLAEWNFDPMLREW